MIQAFLFDHNDIPAILIVAGGLFATALLFLFGYRRSARAAWVAVIGLVSFPFESFQMHAHWEKIGWLPFYSWPVRPLDIITNLALYVPFGILATNIRKRDISMAYYAGVAAEAFLLSLTMEVLQDFSHTRFPSATDLVCNVSGAIVGAALARRIIAAEAV